MTKVKMTSTGLGIVAALLVVAAGNAGEKPQAAAQQKQTAAIQADTTQPKTSKSRFDRAPNQQHEKELRALVPKIVASWESFDTTKVARYYAADADLTYFDLAPMKYNNWAEYREGVQKTFFDPNQSGKFKLNDDLRVHARGALAWATFTFGVDMLSKQGATSHLDGRWTMVLEKRASGWIVVHEHVSVPLAGA